VRKWDLGVNPANKQAPFIGNRSDLVEMTEYLAMK